MNKNEMHRIPGFTAEKALEQRMSLSYTGFVQSSAEGSFVEPTFSIRWSSCNSICQGDPDCIQCCRCVRAGGHPSSCCF
jgi:hypothetical protein